jgi:hypothetical protein
VVPIGVVIYVEVDVAKVDETTVDPADEMLDPFEWIIGATIEGTVGPRDVVSVGKDEALV